MPPLRNAGEWHPWHFVVKIGNTCRAKLTSFCCAGKSAVLAQLADLPAQQKDVSFARQVFPILTTKCQGCHSPALRSGGMVLDSYDNFKKGGRHGAPFLAGQADQSLVLKFLRGDLEPRMPM